MPTRSSRAPMAANDGYRPTESAGFEAVPPHNAIAEEGVIGSLLLAAEQKNSITFAVAKARLDRSDFFSLARGHLYDVVLTLYEMAVWPTWAVVVSYVIQRPDTCRPLRDVDVMGYREMVAICENIEWYISLVSEAAEKRKIQQAAAQIQKGDGDPETSRRILQEAARGQRNGHEARTLDAWRDEAERQLEALAAGEFDIGFGLPTIDRLLRGLRPGWLIILSGRPGSGKSTLAMRLLLRNAVEKGKPCLFFSVEMAGPDVNSMAAQMLAELSLGRRRGTFTQDELLAWQAAQTRFKTLPLVAVELAGITVEKLVAIAMTERETKQTELIVIDYMQIVNVEKRISQRNLEVAHVTQQLKNLARKARVPVVALSQIGRPLADGSGGVMPKWSGEIEEAADVVLLLKRETGFAYGKETEPDITYRHLIVAKNRHGPEGSVRLLFDKPKRQFREEGEQQEAEGTTGGLRDSRPDDAEAQDVTHQDELPF